jgi:hypothetical protein
VHPGTRITDPLDGKLAVDPLDQWDCVLERNCRASTGLTPSNLTGALTGHCLARRRTCEECNGTGEGMWCVIKSALHIVGAKPSKAPTEGRRSCWLFTLLAQSLVKHPLKGGEANARRGYQCSETALTGETWFYDEFVHPQDANHWPPRQETNGWLTGPVRLCIRIKLKGLHNIIFLGWFQSISSSKNMESR